MEHLSKKRIIGIAMVLVVFVLIIAISIRILVWRGLENLKPEYILNVGVDVFGMVMGSVLFICCLIDVQRTGVRNRYFFYLINATFLGLFTDLIAWVVDGIPSLSYVNLLDNTVYYMMLPIEVMYFWLYVRVLFEKEGKREKIASLIMNIGLMISILMRLINIFTGIYFTIDSDGHYARSSWYPLSMVYAFFTTVVTVIMIVRNRKRLKGHQVAAMLIYLFMPFAMSIFTMFTYGLSFNYAMIMIVMLFMYCVININQGREKIINDRELKTAAVIQESVIPHTFPPFPDRKEFEIYALMDAAKDVGGDFYDYFFTDSDHLCLVIADVSGKGVPASLFMMISKILIKSHIQAGESPGTALYNVNNILLDGNTTEMFVTVWMAVVELSTGKVTEVNAGHENPVIKRAGGDFEFIKKRHSPAVSTMEDIPFREDHFVLEPGDTIFVYTDGTPEANNSNREFYGTDRMLEVLNKNKDRKLSQLLTVLKTDVDRFMGDAKQFDDITMLCFKYLGA
ncbi:MAG: serine/threonine-protein phosphatase [Eubacterium sp.]|nr:serine/threonine-protein phosphatase [Eubacterium sp.]